MRVGVLHVNTARPDSTSPTMRIARFAASELGAPLVCDVASAARQRDVAFDVLLVKYGVLKFSQHREDAFRILSTARRVISMENDYLFELDPRVRAPDERWSTVEGRDRYVNWNMLTRLPLSSWRDPPTMTEPEHAGIFYYGAHRPDRVSSFARYFRDAPYAVTISTYRGRAAFLETCGDGVGLCGAFKDPSLPARWPMTIYVEDEASHSLYCSPATRFYECLQIGLAQLIDERSVSTLRRAGVSVSDDHVVCSQLDALRLLPRWREVRDGQRRLWWSNYDEDLRRQFRGACDASGVAFAREIRK